MRPGVAGLATLNSLVLQLSEGCDAFALVHSQGMHHIAMVMEAVRAGPCWQTATLISGAQAPLS